MDRFLRAWVPLWGIVWVCAQFPPSALWTGVTDPVQ